VYHTDRLARGDELIVIASELYHYGIRLESATQDLSQDTTGRIMLHVLAISSRLEYERIMERTQSAKRTRALKGELLGSKTNYGYEYTNPLPSTKNRRDTRNELTIDATTFPDANGTLWTKQQVLTFMVHRYGEGWSIYQIIQWLQQNHFKTQEGRDEWYNTTVVRILKRREYTYGVKQLYVNKYTLTDGHKHYTKSHPDERITTPVPVLLFNDKGEPDIELFERVQERLQSNKTFAARGNRHPEETLLRAGFVRCANCNINLTVHHTNLGRPEYVCGNSKMKRCNINAIIAHRADTEAWEEACRIIRNPHEIREHVEEIRKSAPDTPQLHSAPSRLKEIEEEINSLIDTKRTAKSDTAKKRIDYWLENLENEQSTLIKSERENSLIRGKWELAEAEIQKFEAWCENFKDRLENATYQEKRDALTMLGLQVHVLPYVKGEKRCKITTRPPRILDIVRRKG